jgi:hypothetical protein
MWLITFWPIIHFDTCPRFVAERIIQVTFTSTILTVVLFPIAMAEIFFGFSIWEFGLQAFELVRLVTSTLRLIM